MTVIIVPREEWGALPPKEHPENLILPVKDIVIFPETQTKICKTKKKCIQEMKKLQLVHMECKKLPDIKYNFLVGLDGRIYEGTGWSWKGYDTHISDFKELDYFISICYIGDWEDWDQPIEMKDTVEKLINFGISKNYIFENYSVTQHID